MLESALKAADWMTVFNISGMVVFCSGNLVVQGRLFGENL
jgi:hypothetical protein